MEARTVMRNVRMSAQKVREVVRQIQGLNALHASSVLASVRRKSSRLVAKALKSAVANAENNNGAKAESLRIKAATVGSGTSFKRFTPKARGSAGPRRKRTCSVTIVVSDS